MDDQTLRIVVRIGIAVAVVGMLGIVTLLTRRRGPDVGRTAPPTTMSGRRGPLLAIGAVGAVLAGAGQWLNRGSMSDDPSTARTALSLLGLAVTIGGFMAWGRLVKTGQD